MKVNLPISKFHVKSLVSFSLGLTALWSTILLTLRLDKLSTISGLSTLEVILFLAFITAMFYSIIFFIFMQCFKTKLNARKKIIASVFSFLQTLTLIYFSVASWDHCLLRHIFFKIDNFVFGICFFSITPIFIVGAIIMKKLSKKERQLFIAEVILLASLTPFIGHPLLILGVVSALNPIFSLFIFVINFLLIWKIKAVRFKFSFFVTVILVYLLLIVNIGLIAMWIAGTTLSH